MSASAVGSEAAVAASMAEPLQGAEAEVPGAAPQQGRFRYIGVPVEPGASTASSWTRKRTLALLSTVCLVVVAVASTAWLQGGGKQLRTSGVEAALELEEEELSGTRSCVDVPGLRLDNGHNPLPEVKDKVEDGKQCTDVCRSNAKCGQAIFSAGNKGCYLFERGTSKLGEAPEEGAKFDSAYCGAADDESNLWRMRNEAEREQVKRDWDTAESRAKDLLKKLKLEDKVVLLHGQNEKYPNDRRAFAGLINASKAGGHHGIPALGMNDGPQGFNHYQDALAGSTTQFPCLLALAASFDPGLVWRYADAVADEFVRKGSNVLLGPDIEVSRAPLTGRSFESLSGEDPFLGSELVQPYIKAVQARGIIATVKHWIDNNQEIYRQTMTSLVGEREQHEIYMQPFKAAFDAGAGAVMCAYNLVNGEHACQNKHLLKTLLREELGFKGFVVSDWGATHDAVDAANAGLDIEMQGGEDDEFHKLPDFVESGKVSEDTVDEMAGHVLAAMFAAGQFDGRFPKPRLDWTPPADPNEMLYLPPFYNLNVSSDEHRSVAQDTISQGAVLLKNRFATLPLTTAGKKIALVGKYCDQVTDKSYGQGNVFSGGGSGYVRTNKVITPFQGIKERIKDAADLTMGTDASAAKDADIAVVCVAGHSEEGWDRKDYDLPEAKELVEALRKQRKNQRIVVLAVVPGAVTTDWIKEADAALLLFMPGERVGPAVAQLLTGDTSPGGRLPVSLPEVSETRFTGKQYPGECPPPKTWCETMVANFSEGTLVGYRWNDAAGVPSAFPFGFGLSYTKFKFSNFQVSYPDGQVKVSLTVANIGQRDGAAVPQVYVGFPSLKPVLRQLRGFQKVEIPKGGKASVAFFLNEEDWSFYDGEAAKWVSAGDKGEKITVSVGSSSTDLVWHHVLQNKMIFK